MIEEATNTRPAQTTEREQQLASMLARVLSAAQPGAVFSEPVTKGAYTVITASEISAGGGFGSGTGSTQPAPRQRETASDASQPSAHPVNSSGGGMGGGGGSSGRPVAVIIIGTDGVRIRPVVDVTKIALAGVTVLGTVVMLLRRMRAPKKL